MFSNITNIPNTIRLYIPPNETHITNSSIQHSSNFESQSLFTEDLWKKISPSTKHCLFENNFVFPMDLRENYRYYDVDGTTFVIDLETSIGHAKMGKIRFGQNLKTKEFLAFKTIDYDTDIINENNQEVVALRNLERLRGLIFNEEERVVYMAMELINGATLADYDWEKHSNNLAHAIKLAISFLDELEFVAKSKVIQSDTNPGNTMIDLKKNKIFLIDFGGNGTFDHKTASFHSDDPFPCLNIADLTTVITLLPRPSRLEKKQILTESYTNFHDSLIKTKSFPRHERSPFYLNMTTYELKEKLSLFLQTL